MLAFSLLLAVVPTGSEAPLTKAAFQPLVGPASSAPALVAADADAPAPSLSYTFVEVGATRLDLDTIDDEADSYYGRASLGLFGFLYVFGGYENQSVDFDNADTDIWSLGVGGHFDLSHDLSLFGDVAWLYNDLSSDTLEESSSGALVRIGGRWMALHLGGNGGIELNGGGLWYSLDDSLLSNDDSAGFEAGVRLHFIDFLSFGLNYWLVEDDDAATVNVRFSF